MKHSLIIIVVLFPLLSCGQNKDSIINYSNFDEKYIGKIESNINSIEEKLDKKTLKALQRFQKHERKLNNILAKKDSIAAKNLFANDKYEEVAKKFKDATNVKELKEYIPQLDSLKTSLQFLYQADLLKEKFPKEWRDKLALANTSISSLQSKMQQTNEIKKLIKERKQQIKEQFEKYGLSKHLKKFNKEAYYYQQQLNEYKALLKDPKKLEQRAIAELRKLPAFKEFFQKNSQLAALFRVPEDYGTPQALAGLQTRANVQAQLQQRFAGTSVNPQRYVQQQMQAAQGELNQLKDKINKLGGGGSDMEMPDFKPNSQKTKSFWKRVEYSANVQSQRPNGLLPVTSDVALMAGYKLNDKSVIGLGAGYKLGWGKDWKNIRITHEGISLRSFVDYKIKGGFWISGGYEMNHNQSFNRIDVLRHLDAWQQSGLIGIMKKTKIGKKTNTVQLLWDFMSYQQVPRGKALLFRFGFNF